MERDPGGADPTIQADTNCVTIGPVSAYRGEANVPAGEPYASHWPGADLVVRATTNETDTGRLITGIEVGRSFLKGRDGDRANPVLTAAGYNFRLALKWLGDLLA